MTTLAAETLQLIGHPAALTNMVRRVVMKAGALTLDYFESGDYETITKPDGSPVTSADRAAEDFIIAGLDTITPGLPIVAEEQVSTGAIPDLHGHDYFWLVDAVDGTREFRKGPSGTGDYTVNVALIQKGRPLLGIVYAPVHSELYAGYGPDTAIRWRADSGKEKNLRVRAPVAEGLTVVASQNHNNREKMETFLSGFKVAKIVNRSSSLKICLIAAGKADIYPRPGKTSEWDTAAGDAILRSAGGSIVDLDGNPLSYGHAERKFVNPEFVASSGVWP